MIAEFHAQAIQQSEKCELAGIFARKSEVAEALAQKFDTKAYHDDAAFFADPNIEIVTVATPSGAHLDAIKKAAENGKHVICEKPLEITPERVDQAIQVCDERQVVLTGIFNRRFHPAMELLKRSIDAGRFGKLALAKASIRWYRDPEYYSSSNWKGTWALDGGGALMNQSIHAIDQLLYLAGPVKSVRALTTRIEHPAIETEDTSAAVLEFENGALGLIEGSTACWSQSGNPAEIQLSGSTGTVILQDESFRVWEFKEPDEAIDSEASKHMAGAGAKGLGANDPKAINVSGHIRNFEDAVEAIESGSPPAVDGTEARRAVSLINAIYESAKNDGAKVEI